MKFYSIYLRHNSTLTEGLQSVRFASKYKSSGAYCSHHLQMEQKMLSLRELIYSQSSQGSLFYVPSQPREEPVPQPTIPPTRILGSMTMKAPGTKEGSRQLLKQLPVYRDSPVVRMEKTMTIAKHKYGPGLKGFYRFSQLESSYNLANRDLLRRLWDKCYFSHDWDGAFQILRVMCKIDSIELEDLAKAISALYETENNEVINQITEELYRLARTSHRGVNKDEILKVLIDYYVLISGDFLTARSLTDSLPAFAHVHVILLCMQCIDMVGVISEWMRTNSVSSEFIVDVTVRDVINNFSAFSTVISFLKRCVSSAEYGHQPSYRQDDGDSETNSSDDGGYTRVKVGNKRSRVGLSGASRSLHSPPTVSKREISSLISTLGSSFRSLFSRGTKARVARTDSELSSRNSTATSTTPAGKIAERLRLEMDENDEDPQDRFHGYSVDFHVLYACYLHGVGQIKEGRKEMKEMLQHNPRSARANCCYVRYMCTYHRDKRSDITSAIERWPLLDSSCTEAVYLNLLLRKINISQAPSLPRSIMDIQRTILIDVISGYIEATSGNSLGALISKPNRNARNIHRCDFVYPFCHSRNMCNGALPEARSNENFELTGLISSWTMWRALVDVLGPFEPKMIVAPPDSNDIIVDPSSDIYASLSQKNRSKEHMQFLSDYCIILSPHAISTTDDIEFARFGATRQWWKQSILSWFAIPFPKESSLGCKEYLIELLLCIQRITAEADVAPDPSFFRGGDIKRFESCTLNWLTYSSDASSEGNPLHEESDMWNELFRIASCLQPVHCCHFHRIGCNQGGNPRLFNVCKSNKLFGVTEQYSTIEEMMNEILCCQIIAACHLNEGCQDNFFSIRAFHFLLNQLGRSATALPHERMKHYKKLFSYLSMMNFDIGRATRLAHILLDW